MKKFANVVLYALTAAGTSGFQRQPLASVVPDEPTASVVIAHAATEAFSEAKRRGVPFPVLQCLLEERGANEQGIVISSEYTALDAVTLKPLAGAVAKGTREEHDPKTAMQTVEEAAYAKAKAETEARIQALVKGATDAALKAQTDAIAAQIAQGTLPNMEQAIAAYNRRAAEEKAATAAVAVAG